MPKFVERDASQLYLLPPDIRDWVPEDDPAHFVLEAVERVPMSAFQADERGTGSARHHPRMMLALPACCHANGISGSRRTGRATHRDLGVRYVAADCHPDHDTICAFRRRNAEAAGEAFLQVLLMARELGLPEVGAAGVDGTRLRANASKRNSIRHDRAVALREQLRGGTGDLLGEAERADARDAPDPQSLPEELKRRKTLKAKLDKDCAGLERRAKARAASERAEHERKVAARDKRPGRRKGQRIKPPREGPRPEEQASPADSDSALMRRNRRSEYRQCYNAQAVVDAEGSQLVLGSRAGPCAGDRGELVADVDSMPGALGSPDRALADNGYATGTEVAELENRGGGPGGGWLGGPAGAHDFRPPAPEKPAREPKAEWPGRMRARMATEENRARPPALRANRHQNLQTAIVPHRGRRAPPPPAASRSPDNASPAHVTAMSAPSQSHNRSSNRLSNSPLVMDAIHPDTASGLTLTAIPAPDPHPPPCSRHSPGPMPDAVPEPPPNAVATTRILPPSRGRPGQRSSLTPLPTLNNYLGFANDRSSRAE